jgi:hypothetical protein
MAGDCGHHTCVGCATEAARQASGDRDTITASGILCPFSGCGARLGRSELKRLAAVSCRVLPDPRATSGNPERLTAPLGEAELRTVEMVMEEESIPADRRAWCPHAACARVLDIGEPCTEGPSSPISATSDETPAPSPAPEAVGWAGAVLAAAWPPVAKAAEAFAKAAEGSGKVGLPIPCPWCDRKLCRICKQPWGAHGARSHQGLSCSKVAAQRKSDCNSDDASEALVIATTKPCPNCSFRTSHYQGHSCHHIMPGRGCPNCGTHWCYRCGATRCRCPGGSWSTFCSQNELPENLVAKPYPHDGRCGCPICPLCRPGRPCEQCPGSCGVCRGKVPPGSLELLPAKEKW